MTSTRNLKLSLPLPPPPDHMSGAQSNWLKRAAAEIANQLSSEGRTTLAGHARLRVHVGIVPGRALVTVVPAVVGILVETRLVEGPHVISDLETRWDKTVEPGRVQIEISPAVPPLRRIGAATRKRVAERTRARWAAARDSPQPARLP